MSVKFEIRGLEALKAALRALPEELTAEAGGIVTARAEAAAATIKATYERHRVTGNLAAHVSTRTLGTGRHGVAIQVRSTARHVHFFEEGTDARHYVTKKNGVKHLLGPMPAMATFVPAMEGERARMYDELARLLESKGLTVRGDAG